ncbi:MAG: 50S ribosomal protein L11 methyltransferase, partial [Prolixibacteraceae bacterium]|nr:50S ribosomal protein L11 methyltransferase [Prolixibacteraceae bacterium]
YELVIEPNMAFGTGNHETTSLMIELLLNMELKGKKVLDMGCGTGVLAMLASKLGAKEILAIDIDQWAYEGTLENSRINQCNNIAVKMGDASLLGNQTFDLILANIHKNVLLHDVQKYREVLNPGGMLIMSGFYETDLADITHAAIEAQLHPLDFKVKNRWVAAVYQLK